MARSCLYEMLYFVCIDRYWKFRLKRQPRRYRLIDMRAIEIPRFENGELWRLMLRIEPSEAIPEVFSISFFARKTL